MGTTLVVVVRCTLGFANVLKASWAPHVKQTLFNEVGVEGACEDNICKPFFVP